MGVAPVLERGVRPDGYRRRYLLMPFPTSTGIYKFRTSTAGAFLRYNLYVPASTSAAKLLLNIRGGQADGQRPIDVVSTGEYLWQWMCRSEEYIIISPYFEDSKEWSPLHHSKEYTTAFAFLRGDGLVNLLAAAAAAFAKPSRLSIVANSNGGVLAHHLAMSHPELVASMLILSSAPDKKDLKRLKTTLIAAAKARRKRSAGGDAAAAAAAAAAAPNRTAVYPPLTVFIGDRDGAFLPGAKQMQKMLVKAGASPSLHIMKRHVHDGTSSKLGEEKVLAELAGIVARGIGAGGVTSGSRSAGAAAIFREAMGSAES